MSIVQKFIFNPIHVRISGENEVIFTDPGPTYLPDDKVSVLHYHNRCEIGICKSGNGIWVAGERSYAVTAGDIVVNPAGFPHYSRSIPTAEAPKCRVKFYYFDERRLLSAAGIASDIFLSDGTVTSPIVLAHHSNKELHFLLDKMIDEVQNGADKEHSIKTAAHWYALFLLKLCGKVHAPVPDFQSVKTVFLPAFRKIITEFSEQLTLKELADVCSLSVGYFNAEFSKAFGISPMRYLNQFRIKIASELLVESNISITDICAFVGFNAPSELYRHFVAVYGMSPTEYRSRR